MADSDPYDDDSLCTVIIAVLQKYRREMKHMGIENLPIGFAVYDVRLFHYFLSHISNAFKLALKSSLSTVQTVNRMKYIRRLHVLQLIPIFHS